MRNRRISAFTALLAILALFSGAALLAAILLHVPLGIALLILFAFVSVAGATVVRTIPERSRSELRDRAFAGAVGGICGVVLYDVVRYALVFGLHFHVRPFDALPLFGTLITGAQLSSATSWSVGIAYHYLNGVMFGVSFGVLLGRKSWLWAIPWALGLEVLMLSLYPGFLHIRASVMGEFTVMSLCGHLAYGTGLGLGTRAMLQRIAFEPR